MRCGCLSARAPRRNREQRFERGVARAQAGEARPGVGDDLGLLLDPVGGERPAGHENVAVAAEGMAGEGQGNAALVLPDVGELVNEQRRERRSGCRIIVAPQPAIGRHPDRSVGRHDDRARLERPPARGVDENGAGIERLAEQRRRDRALAGAERAAACWSGAQWPVAQRGAGSPAATARASTRTGWPLAKRKLSGTRPPAAIAPSRSKIIA